MILGSVSDTFGPNKQNALLIGCGGVVGAVVLFVLWAQSGYTDRLMALGLLMVAGAAGALLYYMKGMKVTLHADGVSVYSFTDHTEMRWDQVERFYYHAVKLSINFIPTPTQYFFKLIDRQGRKLWLASSYARPQELAAKLVQFTQPHLLRKALDLYNSTGKVEFGPIHVSRAEGVAVNSLLLRKKIPFNQLASYCIEGGRLYIFRTGEKRSSGLDIGVIPNVFALVGFLDTICRPASGKAQAASTKL